MHNVLLLFFTLFSCFIFKKVYIFLANKTIIMFAYFCTGGITVQQRWSNVQYTVHYWLCSVVFRTVLYTGELCTVLYAVQYSIYTDLLGLYQHFANRARVHKIRTGVGRGSHTLLLQHWQRLNFSSGGPCMQKSTQKRVIWIADVKK